MTLVEFLRARLDEDEQYLLGQSCARAFTPPGVPATEVLRRVQAAPDDPRRLLREVEAKRELVLMYEAILQTGGFVRTLYANAAEPALRLLALPYADYPDYRENWRPTE